MKTKTENKNTEVKIVVKASKVNRRYGLYKVIQNGKEIGFIEKAFHCSSFRIGTPGQPSYQTFGTLQQAVSHLQSIQI